MQTAGNGISLSEWQIWSTADAVYIYIFMTFFR